MVRYARFRKVTSRGTLQHDLALDGKTLYQRSRYGVSKVSGRVSGGLSTSVRHCRSAALARVEHDKILEELTSARFIQYAGPTLVPLVPLASSVSAAKPKPAITGRPRPVADQALARFERNYSVRLPTDYRRFVSEHGPGELLGFVRVHAPRTKGVLSLAALVDNLERIVELDDDGPRARFLTKLFPFADSGGGDLFGWMRRDLAIGHERKERVAVWWCPRDRAAKKVADSFATFASRLRGDQRFVESLFLGLDADPTFRCG